MINKKLLPKHIAIIMDGNGRWASKRFLSKNIGHKKGAQSLENIVEFANEIGIEHLTVFAFSTENWKRSESEVKGIMNLVRKYLDDYLDRIKKKEDDIRIDIIGERTRLDSDIVQKINEIEEKTKDKKGLFFHIALNYGGKDDIVRAVNKIMQTGKKIISEEDINENLDSQNTPDPDLLIRTSGEYRISNFLIWQLAYTEIYFTDKLWPDFAEKDLLDAIDEYKKRERRYGGRHE